MVTSNLKADLKWIPEVKEEFQDNFIGYFDKTSVHGLRYLTERRRPWPEKVLWFVGVSVGLIACIFLMRKTYTRWKEAPVILAMDEQRAVWQVPFPAVTVCPQAKIQKELLDFQDFSRRYRRGELTEEQIELLADIQLPCNFPTVHDDDVKNDTAIRRIEYHALKLEDVIGKAFLQTKPVDFQPIMTEEGLCYSFNMLPASHFFQNNTFHASTRYWNTTYLQYEHVNVQWHPAKGYASGAGARTYPMRSLGPGKDQGLRLHLETKTKDLHSLCSIMGQGFKVFLHSPIEFPRDAPHATYLPLDSVVQLRLRPGEFLTSTKLRHSYSAQQRQCYFPDERPLGYFRYYTQNNCQLECLANRTYDVCKCVQFYMPRLPNMPICGQNQVLCAAKVSGELHEKMAGMGAGKNSLNSADLPCGCISTCTNVWYDSSASQTQLDFPLLQRFFNESGYTMNTDEPVNTTVLMIYFEDYQFLPIRRVEVFGTSDLLASLGGLMGLCMGISLLSIIELFYWMLIRPFCQRIKQRNPDLRSIRIVDKRKRAEAAVQYSRHLDDEGVRVSKVPGGDPSKDASLKLPVSDAAV